MPRFSIPRLLHLGGKERGVQISGGQSQLNAQRIEQDPKDAVVSLCSMGRDYDPEKVTRLIEKTFPGIEPVELSGMLTEIEGRRRKKGLPSS